MLGHSEKALATVREAEKRYEKEKPKGESDGWTQEVEARLFELKWWLTGEAGLLDQAIARRERALSSEDFTE